MSAATRFPLSRKTHQHINNEIKRRLLQEHLLQGGFRVGLQMKGWASALPG